MVLLLCLYKNFIIHVLIRSMEYFNKIFIDLGKFCFRSPLLTKSRLISFPLVTKMFQFTRFLINIVFYYGDFKFNISNLNFTYVLTSKNNTQVFYRLPYNYLINIMHIMGLEPIRSAWKAKSLPVNLYMRSSARTFLYGHRVTTYSRSFNFLCLLNLIN